tara:strand:- start:142 stop:804 length:663 start_codon:yes stop_codon:yes gene_type:complete
MSNYFSYLPDFEYVSRYTGAKISDYAPVKNFFKKGYLRDDIFKDITTFTKYKIEGDDRPDNVAKKIYGDSNLDWIILLSNNVINIQTEWPLTQQNYDNFLLDKYGSYENLNAIHHYESKEIKTADGIILFPAGIWVDEDFSFIYTDLGTQTVNKRTPAIPVTNQGYEGNIQDDKRNIYLLKPEYVSIAIDDLKEIMEYQKGSTQYMSRTLKRGENIRLYS